jgi:hypothetical protein
VATNLCSIASPHGAVAKNSQRRPATGLDVVSRASYLTRENLFLAQKQVSRCAPAWRAQPARLPRHGRRPACRLRRPYRSRRGPVGTGPTRPCRRARSATGAGPRAGTNTAEPTRSTTARSTAQRAYHATPSAQRKTPPARHEASQPGTQHRRASTQHRPGLNTAGRARNTPGGGTGRQPRAFLQAAQPGPASQARPARPGVVPHRTARHPAARSAPAGQGRPRDTPTGRPRQGQAAAGARRQARHVRFATLAPAGPAKEHDERFTVEHWASEEQC